MSKLVEMLKICPCCKYVSNLYQTIAFTSLLRINTYLANICICPHFSRQRKCNANLELQIYHIFAPFAKISKSVFSSSVISITFIPLLSSLGLTYLLTFLFSTSWCLYITVIETDLFTKPTDKHQHLHSQLIMPILTTLRKPFRSA